MKKLITIIICFSMLCCAQNKKEINFNDKKMNTKYPKVDASNFVSEITKKIIRYEKEPMYYMRINKINCLVEILVNDYPVHRDYELANYATPLEINYAILKSGEQKLKYRLYPIGDLLKEEYGEGDTVTTLTNNTSISISIIKMDNNGKKGLEDEEVVIKHISLKDAKGNFIASGKPYYEFTFSFNAKVPYINEGWSNGQDLTKLDPKLIEQKAVEFYKEYGKIHLNNDKNALAKIKFGDDLYGSKSLYFTLQDVNKLWNEDLEDLSYKNMQPLENYKLVFFGNGKIAFLMLKSIAKNYRGGGALIVEGDRGLYMPRIQLYLPENKRLEDGLYMID